MSMSALMVRPEEEVTPGETDAKVHSNALVSICRYCQVTVGCSSPRQLGPYLGHGSYGEPCSGSQEDHIALGLRNLGVGRKGLE